VSYPVEVEQSALCDFLELHPWASETLLRKIFGGHFERVVREKEVRRLQVPGLGTRFAVKTEKTSSLPGVHRYALARHYLQLSFGADVLWDGGSPGLWGSDALIHVRGCLFVRAWADIGDVAIEALPFINPHPEVFAANMKDFVITTSHERARLIEKNIRTFWPSHSDVIIFSRDTGQMITIPASTYAGGKRRIRKILSRENIFSAFGKEAERRKQLVRRESNIGVLFAELSVDHLSALNFVGNNPTFDASDLAYLLTLRDEESRLDRAKFSEIVRYLVDKKLVEDAPPPLFGVRVSSLGLGVLARYWGCDQETLRRFHPWPQVKEKGEYVYSVKPLTKIKEHTRVVQRFVLGLADSAQRLNTSRGGVDIKLDTIIGMRLTFIEEGSPSWVIPDGYIHLVYWKRSWVDGRVVDNKRTVGLFTILLEVDQATNPLTRLPERIEKYRRVWRSIPGNPALVWVINGTPHRERSLLEMMRDMDVPGWTVLLERLVLDPVDPWWSSHPSMVQGMSYSKTGGFAPLRKIWMSTRDHQLHHLFDLSPWRADMLLTAPVRETPGLY